MKQFARICAIAILVSLATYAQGGGYAAMTGTVTDPTGAMIARASVAMTRTGTDNKRTSSTNEKRRRVLLD